MTYPSPAQNPSSDAGNIIKVGTDGLLHAEGAAGQSVNVYGPQSALPAPERPGDVWLVDMDLRAIEEAMTPDATLVPATPAGPAAALSPIPDYPVVYLQHVDHSYPRLLRSK